MASGDASATAAYSLTDRVIFFGSNSILWQLSGGYSRGYAALGGGSFTVGGIQSILTDNGGPSPYFFITPSGVPLDLSLSLMISAYATAIIGSTSGGVSYNISTSGRNNISSPDIPITFASKNGYAYNVYLGTQIPWDPAFDPPPPVATPEPSTWFLIASAILLMALIGRRQRSSFFKSY